MTYVKGRDEKKVGDDDRRDRKRRRWNGSNLESRRGRPGASSLEISYCLSLFSPHFSFFRSPIFLSQFGFSVEVNSYGWQWRLVEEENGCGEIYQEIRFNNPYG